MTDKQEERDSQYEALLNSNFKQQKLSAWRPVPTITSTTVTFAVFGAIFIIIGVVVLVFSNNIKEQVKRYDSDCGNNPTCTIEIVLNEPLEQPIMIYYQLHNFYQNHRRYVKSKSNSQLAGNILTADEIKSDCDPVYLNKHLDVKKSLSLQDLNPDEPANPCGLIAKNTFNDTYSIVRKDSKVKIEIDEKGIAWQSDVDMKFKKPVDSELIQWKNVTDEHFMVWMRPAGLPNFRKLWGRIKENLEKGTYEITIQNSFLVDKFGGEKYFVMSTVNAFGGKNNFLGISYICVGGICLIMALLFFFGYKSHSKTA